MLLVVISRCRDAIYKVNQKDLMDFKYIEDLKVSFGYRGLIPGLTVSSVISTRPESFLARNDPERRNRNKA